MSRFGAIPVGPSQNPKGKSRFGAIPVEPDQNTQISNDPVDIGAMMGATELQEAAIKNAGNLPEFGSNAGLQALFGDSDSKPKFSDLVGDSLASFFSGTPESRLKGIKSRFPNLEIEKLSNGNAIITNPETNGVTVLNKEGLSTADIKPILANLAAFTPAGRAKSIVGAVVTNAATQTGMDVIEGALGGDGANIEETAIAGGLGGAFKAGEQIIGAGYRAAKGNIPQAAKEVIKSGDDAGVPVMTSDVMPPQNFASKNIQATAEKIPFIGTGAVREGQEKLREVAVNDVIEKYGEYSYSSIVDSLKSQRDKVKSAAGSVLESVGKKLDDVGEVDISNTRNAISSVAKELEKKGVIKSNDALSGLREITEALESGPQTFTTLKENRTAFNEILNSVDAAGRSQLGSRAKGLLTGVSKALSRDMDDVAKSNLTKSEFSKWKNANSVYASEAQKLTKTKIKNVLDKGDITPEAVQTMLFSQKPSEVKLLYKSLTSEGKSNARAAIIGRVADTLSKRAGGITPNSFANEMKKQGIQVNTFFKGKDKRQLLGLIKLLDSTKRAGNAAVTTPTGQSLFTLIAGAAGMANIKATAIGAGSLAGSARLYESSAVRNALLKLGSLPRGSTHFEKALLETQSVLNAAFQNNASDIQ